MQQFNVQPVSVDKKHSLLKTALELMFLKFGVMQTSLGLGTSVKHNSDCPAVISF
jgi:hypothetical protein